MAKPDNISMSVIKRMPRYYRFLGNLKNNGVERISSKELSEKMGFTASQIRQDLNCFGGFGQQGYGYNVAQLYGEIGRILGIDNGYKTIIIGMGNLGRAIAAHMNFSQRGFDLIGMFDSDINLSGELVNGSAIRPMATLKDFCERYSPKVAVLCVPEEAAETVVSMLVDYGVTGFWNFSHYDIVSHFPGTVCAVSYTHLTLPTILLV